MYRHLAILVAVVGWNLSAFAATIEIRTGAIGAGTTAKLSRSLVVAGLNRALGGGMRIDVGPHAMSLRLDTGKLPADAAEVRRAVRVFTAVVTPEATAAQARSYGLLLPTRMQSAQHLVVLIHGMDNERGSFSELAKLLEGRGFRLGYFTYPSDQPIADSAELLGQSMIELRRTFPEMAVDVIGHSMGSIVARGYIEGPAYAGGIDHFILLAPPNHGSKWAGWRWVLEAEEHYGLWRRDPSWRPSWLITDGLGEAGRDMRPDSATLWQWNARPRRDGVKYTIISGRQNPAWRLTADWVGATSNWAPAATRNWWGVRQVRRGLQAASSRLRNIRSDNDGPVTLKSARLEGVDDQVILQADHNALYQSVGGRPPAAWAIIRDRLER